MLLMKILNNYRKRTFLTTILDYMYLVNKHRIKHLHLIGKLYAVEPRLSKPSGTRPGSDNQKFEQ